jgi:hypothetical protein
MRIRVYNTLPDSIKTVYNFFFFYVHKIIMTFYICACKLLYEPWFNVVFVN